MQFIRSGYQKTPIIALCLGLLLLLAACGGTSTPQAQKTPTPPPTPTPGQGQQLLNQAGQKIQGASTLHGIFNSTLNGQLLNGTLNLEVWNMAPDKNRTLVLDSTLAQFTTGSINVSDGKQVWQYDPTQKVVYTGPVSSAGTSTGTPGAGAGNGPDQAGFFLNLIQTIFTRSDATLVSATGSKNGHNVYTIHVTPGTQAAGNGTRSFNYDGNVYLDKQTLLPVRIELTIGGLGQVNINVAKLDLNQPLASSLFTFVPPPGTKVLPLAAATPTGSSGSLTLAEAEQQAGYHLLSIPTTHTEYQLQGVDALGAPGSQIYTLHYVQGNLSFTISQGKSLANLPVSGQQISLRGTSSTLSNNGGTTTLVWTEKGVGIQIAGNLTQGQIVGIANLLS